MKNVFLLYFTANALAIYISHLISRVLSEDESINETNSNTIILSMWAIQDIEKNKLRNPNKKALHEFVIYASVIGIVSLIFWSIKLTLGFIAIIILHSISACLIGKCWENKKFKKESFYLTSNVLMTILIITVSYILVYAFDYQISAPSWICKLLVNLFKHPQMILLSSGLFFIVSEPVNTLIKNILKQFKPNELEKNLHSGAIIGILERIIICIFLIMKQYSAIGLVLTAKSIARYKQLTEEKLFAEYYLLGTLLSSLSAIVFYYLYIK